MEQNNKKNKIIAIVVIIIIIIGLGLAYMHWSMKEKARKVFANIIPPKIEDKNQFVSLSQSSANAKISNSLI